MGSVIRHEFVVNREKDPDVAAWIESPENKGKVGATIVDLIRLHLWAAGVLGETPNVRDLLVELQELKRVSSELLASVHRMMKRAGEPTKAE